MWTFKEKEVDTLRRDLTAHKLTLNMAISVANLYNLSTTSCAVNRVEADIISHVRELQEKLPDILRQIEDVKVAQLPSARYPLEEDRNALRADMTLTLRRYVGSAASVISECSTPGTPSIQVSLTRFGGSEIFKPIFKAFSLQDSSDSSLKNYRSSQGFRGP